VVVFWSSVFLGVRGLQQAHGQRLSTSVWQQPVQLAGGTWSAAAVRGSSNQQATPAIVPTLLLGCGAREPCFRLVRTASRVQHAEWAAVSGVDLLANCAASKGCCAVALT
jgi:hypothetical protein